MMDWVCSDVVDEKCMHTLMGKRFGKRSAGWRHDCNINIDLEEVNFDGR
jgi:hypothetical protein